MPRTKLIARADALLKSINELSPRKATALSREILRVLETGEESDALRAFASTDRGLRKVVQELYDEAAKRRLAGAVYLHAVLDKSVAKARERTGATDEEWRYASGLARQLKVDLGSYARALDPATEWVSLLLSEAEDLIVILDDRAAEDMVLVALEGYLVPASRKKPYTEVYGICLGSVRRVAQKHPGRGVHVTTFLTVTRCTPQIRAKADMERVFPNLNSLVAHLEAADALFPQLELLGDFHSHPYATLTELYDNKGWHYSPEDEAYNVEWVKLFKEASHRPRVGFIIAIARMGHATAGPHGIHGPNTYQFTIRGHRLVIGAYRILDDGTYSGAGVELRCDVGTG